MRWIARGALALVLAVSSLSMGCASQVREDDPYASARAASDREVKEARAALEANPNDLTLARRLVQVLLNARRFTEAFEQAQKLRELEPESAQNLALLGHACFGLGLFDEAAACFNAALQRDTGDAESAWWLSYLLIARGSTAEARKILTAAADKSPDWRFYEMLLEITPALNDQLKLVTSYLESTPDDEKALKLQAALKQRAGRTVTGRITAGGGEVIQASMTDSYKVTMKINGFSAAVLFDTGSSGIQVSDDLATKLSLPRTEGFSTLAVTGRSGAIQEVMLKKLEVGGLVLEDVPARIRQDLDEGAAQFSTSNVVNVSRDPESAAGKYQSVATGMSGAMLGQSSWYSQFDAIVGPDFLPGYSFQLDRRGGNITLYPPDRPLPKPSAAALIQPFYHMGSYLLTDAVIRNRSTDQAWKTKMGVSIVSAGTLYELGYADRMQFGTLNTTRTTTVKEVDGYSKYMEVILSEVQLGTTKFALDQFWAANLKPAGRFTPFGMLGRDILSRYRVTLDTRNHQLILELYEG